VVDEREEPHNHAEIKARSAHDGRSYQRMLLAAPVVPSAKTFAILPL
jgi:hypothetical protein